MKINKIAVSVLALATCISAHAQGTAPPLVPVTIDNFARAATDIEFDKYVSLAGGVNRFYHFREPTTGISGDSLPISDRAQRFFRSRKQVNYPWN